MDRNPPRPLPARSDASLAPGAAAIWGSHTLSVRGDGAAGCRRIPVNTGGVGLLLEIGLGSPGHRETLSRAQIRVTVGASTDLLEPGCFPLLFCPRKIREIPCAGVSLPGQVYIHSPCTPLKNPSSVTHSFGV